MPSESLLMLLAPVRDILTWERKPRACAVCACSPLLGQYLARERILTWVQKYFFFCTSPCSSKRCSLPRAGEACELLRMCARWEKELPSFGASLGIIMAQGGLAHDQSVFSVASCPGHSQLSCTLRGSLKRSDPAVNVAAPY